MAEGQGVGLRQGGDDGDSDAIGGGDVKTTAGHPVFARVRIRGRGVKYVRCVMRDTGECRGPGLSDIERYLYL
ncbi:pollen-specific leucine-rich repeat extensin-like protein 4 [Iris pallida]|uniref:Pollen-specific leucine-rich repeat extensin-like protein 4 n=1 Tax=Iris pallida TaxID=29817 RepID=A0AAX6FC55_IRIPA|nr:pollen-specific leucine-rich repeat extensin-like protein 4 [Iris pallida]